MATKRFTENDVEVIGLDVAKPEDVSRPGDKVEVEIVTDAKHAVPVRPEFHRNDADAG